MVQRGTSSFNIVNVFSNLNIPDISIIGGSVSNDGSADNNSVNISGDISSDGDIWIIGGRADRNRRRLCRKERRLARYG
jgi:hypothetical protein